MDLIHPEEKARIGRFAKGYLTAYILARGGESMSLPSLRGSAGRGSSKRKRESQDLSQASTTTVQSALTLMHNNHEMIDRKRAPPVTYRLHPAKYLQMDKMLKSMFFPLMTTMLKFGISSFSGCNLINAADKTQSSPPSGIADKLRTRGLYRGVCMFDVRNTDGTVTRDTTNALNCATQQIGQTDLPVAAVNPSIWSHYRRFNSQPLLNSGRQGDAEKIVNASPDLVNTNSETQNTIRSLTLGSNLSDIEENAIGGMCYADPAISQYRVRSITTSSAAQEGAANTGLIAGESGPLISSSNTTWTGPDQDNYFTHLENATMRIVDGHLKLDIMNTEQTPCVVEVVIHSKKKNTMTKAQIFDQLWNDVNRHLKAKGVTDAPSVDANPSGGWQAFFDPNYPLLKVPSNARCLQYVSEVHRSNHVLAPGQSKQIKIFLGNLWYKLGNKTDVIDDDLSGSGDAQQFPKVKDNVGALYCTIGHSGFEYPQSVASFASGVGNVSLLPGTLDPDDQITGTGFWVGKSFAPSSISVDGEYQDKYYPTTIDRSPNNIINSGQPRIANLGYGGGFVNGNTAVPLATIIPQRVATSSGVVEEV